MVSEYSAALSELDLRLTARGPKTRPACHSSTTTHDATPIIPRDDIFPLRLLLATFAGWVNREQAQIVAYLIEENRVLREQLGEKRPRLTDDQRRLLVVRRLMDDYLVDPGG